MLNRSFWWSASLRHFDSLTMTLILNGLYSQKRNKFSVGINLTTQTWFTMSLSFVLQANSSGSKQQIKLEVLKAEGTSISPCFPLLFHFQNSMKNKLALLVRLIPWIKVEWNYSSFKNTCSWTEHIHSHH